METIKCGRKNHRMTLKQVVEKGCVSFFCLGVKVPDMNGGGGNNPGIGINEVNHGNMFSVAQALLKLGPPTAADFDGRVAVRRMRHQDVERKTNGRNTKEYPVALVGIEIDDLDLLLSK